MPKCPSCHESVQDVKYLYHLKAYHAEEVLLTIPCFRCDQKFVSIPSFQKHWYSEHHIKTVKHAPESFPCGSDVLCGKVPASESKLEEEERTENKEEKGGFPLNVQAKRPLEEEDKEGNGSSSKVVCLSEVSCENQPASEVSFMDVSSDEKFEEDEERVDPSKSRVESEVKSNVESSSSAAVEMSLEKEEEPPKQISSSDQYPFFNVEDRLNILQQDVTSDEESDQENIGLSESKLEGSEVDQSDALQPETILQKPPNFQSESPDLKIDAANFLLSLREKSGVKANSVLEIMKDTEDLIKKSIEKFASEVRSNLSKKNVVLDEVMDVNDSIKCSSDVFSDVGSIYKQNKLFCNSLGVVPPEKVPLGRELKRGRMKGSTERKTVLYYEEFMYVPLAGTLNKLVNHPDYQYLVENRSGSVNSKFLDSYMKGEACKRNKVLCEHPDALRLVLYFDDLEVCSPLKSKAGNQKLSAFYMFLDNIPAHLRSDLNLIFLLGLVNAKLVKKYGIDSVLDRIVHDLKKLENGMVLPNGQMVYGTLIAVIGDNLGLHQIGGFKEGFTAHRCCRFCSVTYEELQTMFREVESRLRDKDSHREQVERIQTAKGKRSDLSTEFGVNRDSKLNELVTFHVTESMPPDIMHDLLEGVLPLTIKRLLHYYLYKATKKCFTLDWLNKSIKDFDFDYLEASDKPSEIKSEHLQENGSLHQSASQMWLLAVILPLILSPLISTDDDHWQNYLDLLEICRIVFTVNISEWMVSYLNDKVEVYLADTVKLYGHIVPKMHHMVHYGSQILRMGSLTNYLCMRLEAKHKFFKQLVTLLGTYKNIPLTLAEKHQMHQGYCWGKSLLRSPKYGPTTTEDKSSLPFDLPSKSDQVVFTKWLELNGIKYIPERCFIAVGCQDYLPVFGFVEKIFIHPEILFICKKVKTIKHDCHSASFIVEVLTDVVIYKPQDLIVHPAFHCHFMKEQKHIYSKMCIGDSL